MVHAVGSLLHKPARRCTYAEWRAVMPASLDSAFLVLLLVAQAKMLCSSVAVWAGLNNRGAIAAAKAWITGQVLGVDRSFVAIRR
jgi:hypothetical protein